MLRNIPARKDFRHGNLRLFHLNHRLLIGLIGPKIKLTVVNYQQIVLSWQLVVSDGGSGGGGGVEAQMRQSSAGGASLLSSAATSSATARILPFYSGVVISLSLPP